MRDYQVLALSRLKIYVTSELSLYSKLSGVTVLKDGQGTIVGGNPEVYQGTEVCAELCYIKRTFILKKVRTFS